MMGVIAKSWNDVLVGAAVMLSLSAGSHALGQTDQRLLFDDWDEGHRLNMSTEMRLFRAAAVEGSSSRSSTAEYGASGRLRLDTTNAINPSIGFDAFVLTSDLRDARVPRGLTDSSIALATPLGEIDNWFFAVSGGMGYAGDAAFGNGDAWYGKGDLTAGYEISEHEHLLVWLAYDGNRLLLPDVPTPGIAYANDSNESFSYVLGLPDSQFEWHPTPKSTLRVEWSVPLTIDAEAEIEVVDSVSLYTQYRNTTRAFHTETLDRDRRLFFDQQTVEAGVRWTMSAHLAATLASGYAFSREFQTGFDDRNLKSVAKLGDAPFVRIEIGLAF